MRASRKELFVNCSSNNLFVMSEKEAILCVCVGGKVNRILDIKFKYIGECKP